MRRSRGLHPLWAAQAAVATQLSLSGAAVRSRRHRRAANRGGSPEADDVLTVTLELLAHDLKSPLSASRRAIEQVLSSQREDDVELLSDVAATLEYVQGIANGLLRLDHLQSDCLDQTVNLDELARVCARDRSSDGRIDTLTIGAEIRGDAALLKAAIGNLLDNALRHTRNEVLLRAGPVEPGALVMVDDDGDGIPPALRELVFQPLVRLDHDDTGSGLGLALVRRVARLHGGEAWADASPSGGARFCLWLPRRRQSAGPLSRSWLRGRLPEVTEEQRPPLPGGSQRAVR